MIEATKSYNRLWVLGGGRNLSLNAQMIEHGLGPGAVGDIGGREIDHQQAPDLVLLKVKTVCY